MITNFWKGLMMAAIKRKMPEKTGVSSSAKNENGQMLTGFDVDRAENKNGEWLYIDL
jgi:hypothetical protein